MENRVTISICGESYTLLAEESPSYMQRVGQYVDAKMSDTLKNAKVGRTDAAVLTAVNLADELMKAQQAADNLRQQVKEYLDEASRAKTEASDLRRELFKLQNRGGSAGNSAGGNRR